MTNQVDITSSKYLVKPNNLTTPYFNPEEIDISGKEDIEDHNADIHRLEIDISGKENVSNHNADISNLQSQINILTNEMSSKESVSNHDRDVSNINTALSSKVSSATYSQGMTNVNNELALKETITAHNADITQLSNSIATLQTKIEKEYVGNYYVDKTNRRIYFANGLIFNYNYLQNEQHPDTYIAVNLYRPLGSYATIKDLILPGSLYTDPNLDFHYWWSGSTTYSNLTSLTISGDLFNINLNLDYMPKLQHFNLMEGLQEITINSNTSSMKSIPSLKIPSSVKACYLTSINFNDLIFEGGTNLKLVLTECSVSNKIICERELTSDSNIERSIPFMNMVIKYLSVDYSFLSKLSDTNTFGEIILIDTQDNPQTYHYSDFTTLFLTGEQKSHGAYPALKINLHFKVIHNLIGDNHYYYTGLSANRWIE